MQLAAIFTTLLSTFATSPDLCADVHLDPAGEPYTDSWGQTLPRYCEWTGPDAPLFDGDVCCTIDGDGALCSMPDANGRCAVGFKMYCEFAEVLEGEATCYRPFPSACNEGHCAADMTPPASTQPDLMCCGPSVCQALTPEEIFDCEDNDGTLLWCDNGVSNEDGTVDCYD